MIGVTVAKIGDFLLLVTSAAVFGFGVGALVLAVAAPATDPIPLDMPSVTLTARAPVQARGPEARLWPPVFGVAISDPPPTDVLPDQDAADLLDLARARIRLVGLLLEGYRRNALVEIEGQIRVLSEGDEISDGMTLVSIRWGHILVSAAGELLEFPIQSSTDRHIRARPTPASDSVLPVGRYPGFEAIISN
jgi:hypothetical protein